LAAIFYTDCILFWLAVHRRQCAQNEANFFELYPAHFQISLHQWIFSRHLGC